jgi:hypothetical protein
VEVSELYPKPALVPSMLTPSGVVPFLEALVEVNLSSLPWVNFGENPIPL